MMAVTIVSCQRYGVKSRPMRRSDTSRACAFSAAVTVRGPLRWPALLISWFVSEVAKRFSILSGMAVAEPCELRQRLRRGTC